MARISPSFKPCGLRCAPSRRWPQDLSRRAKHSPPLPRPTPPDPNPYTLTLTLTLTLHVIVLLNHRLNPSSPLTERLCAWPPLLFMRQ